MPDIKISNFSNVFSDDKKGISFKIDYQGSFVPMRIFNTFGKKQAYAASAAVAVGLSLGLNLVEIAHGLKNYKNLPGRTNLISGIKNTFIIDDTYNASPLATISGLEILEEFPSQGKKIAVLGDMLQLGEYSEAGHRQVGEKVSQIANILIIVGEKSKFISDEAKKQGLSEKNIFEFDNTKQAGQKLQEILEKDDVIFVKGSRAMQMEEIVKEIMLNPEKAKKLLVH